MRTDNLGDLRDLFYTSIICSLQIKVFEWMDVTIKIQDKICSTRNKLFKICILMFKKHGENQ